MSFNKQILFIIIINLSFVFGKRFILIRDLESIPRTPCVKWEYTHHAHPPHLGAIHLRQLSTWHVFWRLEEPREPGGNPHGHVENM